MRRISSALTLSLLVGCGSSVTLQDGPEGTGGAGGVETTTGAGPATGGNDATCEDRMPTALELEVRTTPPLGAPGVGIDVAAECFVDDVDSDGFSASCQDEQQGDFALTVKLEGSPTDMRIPLEVDDFVRVDLVQQPPGMHQQPTTFLSVQDSGGAVRLVAVSFGGGIASRPDRLAELGGRVAEIDLAVDETLCPANACGDPDQRLGIRVSDDLGQELTVTDTERRATVFDHLGAELDLWVGTARSSECVNVVDTYHFVLTSTAL